MGPAGPWAPPLCVTTTPSDVESASPLALVDVTRQLTVLPTSAATGVYAALVAPAIAVPPRRHT